MELERIAQIHERHGERFVRRICRPGECKRRQGEALIQHLGGLFAAKEAALKALGTGWAAGLGLRQVEVTHAPNGAPGLRLHAAAAERFAHLGAAKFHLTISHERTHAVAMAVLEGPGPASREDDEHE